MRHLSYPQVWFTYGPQTSDDNVIRHLLEAGATGARLTFSYGTPELQADRAKQIRKIAKELSRDVFLVADLQGEKCRLSKIGDASEIPVRAGEPFLLTRGESDLQGNPMRLPLQIPSYIDELASGDIVIEGDGALLIEVIEKRADGALCSPQSDGVLHPGRGIIVRKPEFRPAPMTSKDESDLLAVVGSELFDAIAISFVGSPDDIRQARSLMGPHKDSLSIIAKIETQLGVDNIESIASETDVLMAARGDLALTAPWEELYASVVSISQAAIKHNTPWILATQLAEGLERFVFPTRAEICDLAHWVSMGAQGAMLSYETAFGPRPVDAVRAVRGIVDRYCISYSPSSSS